MSNELANVQGVSYALVRADGDNYVLTIRRPDGTAKELLLERGVDFGNPINKKTGKNVFPQPTLYKSGAEKIVWEYGVADRYELMHALEDFEKGIFFYRFKCSLVLINPTTLDEVVLKEGYGSANSREGNSGNANGFDLANSKMKIAEKRALVDAAIKMGRLSSLFTQDLENENFMEMATELTNQKGEDDITPAQRKRIFAIGSSNGFTTEQIRTELKAIGFVSTKDIKQKDYNEVCKWLQGRYQTKVGD